MLALYLLLLQIGYLLVIFLKCLLTLLIECLQLFASLLFSFSSLPLLIQNGLLLICILSVKLTLSTAISIRWICSRFGVSSRCVLPNLTLVFYDGTSTYFKFSKPNIGERDIIVHIIVLMIITVYQRTPANQCPNLCFTTFMFSIGNKRILNIFSERTLNVNARTPIRFSSSRITNVNPNPYDRRSL